MNRGPAQHQSFPPSSTARSAGQLMLRPLTLSLRVGGFRSRNPAPHTSPSLLTSAGALRLSNAGTLEFLIRSSFPSSLLNWRT